MPKLSYAEIKRAQMLTIHLGDQLEAALHDGASHVAVTLAPQILAHSRNVLQMAETDASLPTDNLKAEIEKLARSNSAFEARRKAGDDDAAL